MAVGFDIGFLKVVSDISFTRISNTLNGTIDAETTDLSVFKIGNVVTILNSDSLEEGYTNDGTFLVTSSQSNSLSVTRLTPADNEGVSVPVVPMTKEASPNINISFEDIVCPDRNLRKIITPQVLTAEFGDGYEGRIKQGAFTRQEEYSVKFINRPPEIIESIIEFFERTEGVKSFTFVVREDPYYAVPVICQQYSISYDSDFHAGCEAKFKRVKQ